MPGEVARVAEEGFDAEAARDEVDPCGVVLASHLGDFDGGRVGWMVKSCPQEGRSYDREGGEKLKLLL